MKETSINTLINWFNNGKSLSKYNYGRRALLSKRTIDGHRQALLEKTGIRNMEALAVYCFNKKLKKLEDVG